MSSLTHLSLFPGVGGLDLAAEWAGFETVGQCEWADYPTAVLEKHWPDVPRWKDVRDVTAESVSARGIDNLAVLSGGFPCQPHSLAGKRLASGDERDLWGEFARVVREVNPRWVVGENVPGLLSSEHGRFFGRVLRDLAQMGYCVGWCCYPASWVGAAHRRERVFIIANTERRGSQELYKGHGGLQEIFKKGASAKTCFNITAKGIYGLADSGCLRKGDGVPHRVDRVKALGNAVVPQQAYPIFAAIAAIERARLSA